MPITIWKIVLECTSGLHTMGDVEGSYIDYLKYSDGSPFIPATHIKGVLRCEAERLLRGDPSRKMPDCSITGDPKTRQCDDIKNGKFGCIVCKIFGPPRTAGITNTNYLEGNIRVTDFRSLQSTQTSSERRTHVVINRDTQTKEKHLLFSRNIVSTGTRFRGFILLRENLSNPEEELLTASIHAMADYGLGGNRSRGLGAVKLAREIDKTVTIDKFNNQFVGGISS